MGIAGFGLCFTSTPFLEDGAGSNRTRSLRKGRRTTSKTVFSCPSLVTNFLDPTGEGIAAEGAAVLARLEHAQDLRVGEHCRDRIEAAGQRLADQREVGLDA